MIYFLSDIDDTLLQSAHKCPVALDLCNARSITKDGKPQGFSTPAQEALLKSMLENGALIPVTARNLNAFNRVNIEFNSYVAISHGSVILNPDRTPCTEWLDVVKAEADIALPLLEELAQELAVLAQIHKCTPTISKISWEFDIPTYFNVKVNASDSKKLENVANHLKQTLASSEKYSEFCVHVNDRNLSILPPYASKHRAAEFILKKLGATEQDLTFGLGDSISDWKFMKNCTFSVIPRKTQLANSI